MKACFIATEEVDILALSGILLVRLLEACIKTSLILTNPIIVNKVYLIQVSQTRWMIFGFVSGAQACAVLEVCRMILSQMFSPWSFLLSQKNTPILS